MDTIGSRPTHARTTPCGLEPDQCACGRLSNLRITNGSAHAKTSRRPPVDERCRSVVGPELARGHLCQAKPKCEEICTVDTLSQCERIIRSCCPPRPLNADSTSL